jgi:hypothetical protein
MRGGEPSTLFRNPEEYLSFADALAPAYQQYEVRLKVLIWGPGERANLKWWEKRAQLVWVLRKAYPDDEIVTSEELFRELGDAPIETGRFEIHHAEKADLILALVLGSPKRQGGVYRELEIIADRYELRGKTHIFLPRNSKTYINRFQAGSLQLYRDSHKYLYSWSALNTCNKVTATSISIINEERKQRMYVRAESISRNRTNPR